MNIIEVLRYVRIKEMVDEDINKKSQIIRWLAQINVKFSELYETSNQLQYVQITLEKIFDPKWYVIDLELKYEDNYEVFNPGDDILENVDISNQNVLGLIRLDYSEASIHVSDKPRHVMFTITQYLLKQIENKDKKIDTVIDVIGNTI